MLGPSKEPEICFKLTLGFVHRGYVIESMDGRLWYNHFQENGGGLYIVYLNSLLDLHTRHQILYSQQIEEVLTIGEHVEAWGVSIGMYFRTCNG